VFLPAGTIGGKNVGRGSEWEEGKGGKMRMGKRGGKGEVLGE